MTFIEGQFTHAYVRPSLLVHGEDHALSLRTAIEPAGSVLAFAKRIISAASPTMWARVDVVDAQKPLLNELELVDPNLLMSFSHNRECYERLADAIEMRLNHAAENWASRTGRPNI